MYVYTNTNPLFFSSWLAFLLLFLRRLLACLLLFRNFVKPFLRLYYWSVLPFDIASIRPLVVQHHDSPYICDTTGPGWNHLNKVLPFLLCLCHVLYLVYLPENINYRSRRWYNFFHQKNNLLCSMLHFLNRLINVENLRRPICLYSFNSI